ncbi:MAG TPA: asparaginase [Gaiellaceae bacterium]|nr:asparaginase [Gaiellaceae bacterium]
MEREPIVVETTRGDVVEAVHRVHAVAVSDGAIVESAGDPSYVTYFRSAAKPFQALPLVRVRPDLDDAEIAIACASHSHRPDHLTAVRSLLGRADAAEGDLECGTDAPLEHTCSGKHAAMLLLCRERGWPLSGYRLATHPCQEELLQEVAAAADLDARSITTAVDGCGVPTFALPLDRMARAFSRLDELAGGQRAAGAMRARPELVSGTVRVDTELMLTGRGWAAKYGAEGLLCAVSDGLGVAVKVEDGAPRALGPALATFLGALGLESGDLGQVPVTNSRGEVVGELRAS